jgi:predicted esterase
MPQRSSKSWSSTTREHGNDGAQSNETMQLSWIELPPIAEWHQPSRLLVFLPGDGACAESFSPVAIAWQLKFPGALGVILQPPLRGNAWWPSSNEARFGARSASRGVAQQIRSLQALWGLLPSQTAVVAFAQGAILALELARASGSRTGREPGAEPGTCAFVVAYAARLAGPILAHESITCTVHLIHGDLDHRVPYIFGHQAYRSLKAAGADVTWDLLADAAHTIGQEGVIVGTARAMQSIFKGRSRQVPQTLR